MQAQPSLIYQNLCDSQLPFHDKVNLYVRKRLLYYPDETIGQQVDVGNCYVFGEGSIAPLRVQRDV